MTAGAVAIAALIAAPVIAMVAGWAVVRAGVAWLDWRFRHY
jgi:hypothetical protein